MLAWWMLVCYGLVFIGAEMMIGSFYLLSLGSGAIVAGLATYAFDFGGIVSMIIWTIASLMSLAVFYFLSVNSKNRNHVRLTAELFSSTRATASSNIKDTGEVLLQGPVNGRDRWKAKSSSGDLIKVGVLVNIVAIEGDVLLVVSA